MSSKQFLINSIVKHQVFLNRYAGGTFNQLLPFINKLESKLLKIIANTKPPLSKTRYEDILSEIRALQKTIFTSMNKKATQQMKALAKYEVQFTERLNKQALINSVNFDLPTSKQIQDAAFTTIIDGIIGVNKKTGGVTVGDVLNKFGTEKAVQLTDTVRQGFALGNTIDQMLRDIAPLFPQMKHQARALTQTITSHVAANSRMSFYKENLDLIEAFQVVATLDAHTTLTCINLDGQVFPVDEFVEPPYHWNCRSTFISVFKPEFGKRKETIGRPSATGEVSTATKYSKWILDQSKEFQDEVLGPERAALMRSGMSVDKFVDTNYQPINIDQLRTKDNEHIFDKAGL